MERGPLDYLKQLSFQFFLGKEQESTVPREVIVAIAGQKAVLRKIFDQLWQGYSNGDTLETRIGNMRKLLKAGLDLLPWEAEYTYTRAIKSTPDFFSLNFNEHFDNLAMLNKALSLDNLEGRMAASIWFGKQRAAAAIRLDAYEHSKDKRPQEELDSLNHKIAVCDDVLELLSSPDSFPANC